MTAEKSDGQPDRRPGRHHHWLLVWRLAGREMRAGLSGFRVFLASLALGVAIIAAVGTISSSVLGTLQADARALLGGDVAVQLVQRPPTAAEGGYLRDTAAALSQVVEMRAMALPPSRPGARALVELKAVDAAYPLVGDVEARPSAPLTDALARRGLAWGGLAEQSLLNKLGLSIGDTVKVGEATVEIGGVIEREPDRAASVITFGPRLMISAEALAATGLVQPGSLVRYHTRLLLPQGAPAVAWIEALKQAFPQAGWQIRDASDASPGVQRFVERLGLFLSFAGLAALLIGGLGVANAVKHYLDRKVETIATLKCLGATGGLVARVYLLQIVALALLGIAIGVVAGAALPLLALAGLAGYLPVRVAAGLYPLPLFEAAALGLLTAVTFALWPLGQAREVRAANLFRHAVDESRHRPPWPFALAAAGGAVALAALTVLTSGDRMFGAWFVAGAILTLLILRAAATGIAAGLAQLPRARSAVVRMAIASLRRPGAPTISVVMSLGAGLTVLVAIALIDANLRSQIAERLPGSVPAFFFIDIQDDQAADFDATVRAVPGVNDLKRMPALRGRIVEIAGVPVETARVAPESAWAVNGDRALTYAAALPEDAKITAGTWWPAGYRGEPLLSFDAGLAAGFGVGVGDTLTLNVLGRNIVVKIASLREIEWRAVPFDFALILAPDVLEGAPHTHIAAVYADPPAEAALESAVTERFANITAIPTRTALAAISALLTNVAWGVRAAASVTLIAGILVLAGAIAADRRQRRYEAVLFKVLGATRGRIALTYVVEYGLLGLVTAAVAAALGTAVAWAVVHWLMDFEWTLRVDIVAATLAICVVLTLAIGFTDTWRSLSQKGAPLLRNE